MDVACPLLAGQWQALGTRTQRWVRWETTPLGQVCKQEAAARGFPCQIEWPWVVLEGLAGAASPA